MLIHLSIRDVVLIEALDLCLHSGLTVLTGETGAGKSILLDSLGLALGKRANSDIIRNGATQSSVTASFELRAGHEVFGFLEENGLILPEDGEPLIFRRIITTDGRSRAYINDQSVGITTLRKAAMLLVEIQGQHEQVGLTDQSSHGDLLDVFGVEDKLRRNVATTWQDWQKACQTLNQARQALEDAVREEEWLRQTVDDLARLSPQEGEEEQLAALRVKLQQDERRGEAVASALSELTPRDRRTASPATALRSASRALARLLPNITAQDNLAEDDHHNTHQAQAQEALNALEQAEEALANAEMLLSRLAVDTNPDMRQLEETEERLFSLRAEARKHNLSVAELPGWRQQLEDRLTQLETGTAEIITYEKDVVRTRADFEQAARALSAARSAAAESLEKAVIAELKPLKLERARFIVEITELPPENWTYRGMEQIAFLIAANPGQPAGPLGKVASGGELSRLMLALKVILAGRSSLTTLVFDEVDAGVGGSTASAIGTRLHRIARNIQVLAITHSPQVAARGDHQLRIAKRVIGKQTQTTAEPLSDAERREEIARMLAGTTTTDAARAAADSLLHQGAA